MSNLTLQIQNSTFDGNKADIGSCIFLSRETILAQDSYIKDCSFINNIAGQEGGIMVETAEGGLDIYDNIFRRN